jgi:hypothetical protein
MGNYEYGWEVRGGGGGVCSGGNYFFVVKMLLIKGIDKGKWG